MNRKICIIFAVIMAIVLFMPPAESAAQLLRRGRSSRAKMAQSTAKPIAKPAETPAPAKETEVRHTTQKPVVPNPTDVVKQATAETLCPEVQQTIAMLNEADNTKPAPPMSLLKGIRLKPQEVLALNEALGRFLSGPENEAIRSLNRYRMSVRLYPCMVDLSLCAAARDHSSNMRLRGFFSHVSPNGETFSSRAARYRVSASAENIFMGSSSGVAAHNAWVSSPGHHANMVGGHTRVGVGSVGGYFTQMFGR